MQKMHLRRKKEHKKNMKIIWTGNEKCPLLKGRLAVCFLILPGRLRLSRSAEVLGQGGKLCCNGVS